MIAELRMPAQGPVQLTTGRYARWCSMKSRCLNPRDSAYQNYGARGIKVCERWAQSFHAFMQDMGERPGPTYSLDRIDNNGNYEPGNCRWATPTQQANNKRNNTLRLIEHDGVVKTPAQVASEIGISLILLKQRLRAGWPVERAILKGKQRPAQDKNLRLATICLSAMNVGAL